MTKSKPQIYDILKREHEEVDELLHQLKEAKGNGAQKLFAEVRLKLVPHSRGEETAVYPRLLAAKNASEKTRVSLEEHRQVDVLLEELAGMSPRDDEWTAKVHVLADMVGHHVDEEEGELFPLARAALSDREAAQITEEYERARDEAAQSMTVEEGEEEVEEEEEEERGAAE
ncbi:Hemerythrin HHE cation binding domain-containing protein [Nannocystis exedens]|uniref:Hemerythrin HHE cation binding domain-containing protein n=1 Tax=Nannocystis exedens TaxID=54 RepID=A0A1I2IW68_9BACT|nr:hemerythrin domain-containing protein [Nannocystis exedens]PCC67175.1 DNA nickase [Nannocystis exedens]SFF46544.1 Hemerythrin HHE cation binding domain-containing protein [Nannocystis exedens]